ncbi:MAG: MFS transporter, partial [Spirochaetaceae bacterium]|nr:MFS transporter [Spirochaetaceae bacterium]
LGFFLLRFSGQGVMTMASRSTAMKWFDQRRGLAAALMGVVTSFGFSYAPKILDRLIQNYTWRGAWLWLALGCGFIFALIALIFQRDNPRDCGLKPDSLRDISVKGKIQKRKEGQDLSLSQAKKNPILWIFAMALALWALYNTALTFHVVSLFHSVGIEREKALSIFFPVSVISVASRFLVSAISDRIRLENLYLYIITAMPFTGVSQLFLDQPIFWYLLILGLGLASGAFGALASITWVRLFGKAHLGAISGFAMGWIVAGSAVGPYFFSLSERVTRGYNWGAYLSLGISIILLFAVLAQLRKK